MSVSYGLFGNSSGPTYENGTALFDSGLQPIPSMAMLDHNDHILLGATNWFPNTSVPISSSIIFYLFIFSRSLLLSVYSKTCLRKMYDNQNSETVQQYHRNMTNTYEKLFQQTGLTAVGYDISDICDAVMYMHDQKFVVFFFYDALLEFSCFMCFIIH